MSSRSDEVIQLPILERHGPQVEVLIWIHRALMVVVVTLVLHIVLHVQRVRLVMACLQDGRLRGWQEVILYAGPLATAMHLVLARCS